MNEPSDDFGRVWAKYLRACAEAGLTPMDYEGARSVIDALLSEDSPPQSDTLPERPTVRG